MKLPTTITWQPWKRWFESASAPPITLTEAPRQTIRRNVTPRQIREARNWTRVP